MEIQRKGLLDPNVKIQRIGTFINPQEAMEKGVKVFLPIEKFGGEKGQGTLHIEGQLGDFYILDVIGANLPYDKIVVPKAEVEALGFDPKLFNWIDVNNS